MSNTINGAAAVIKCLEAENINIVFGIPGATVCPIYDAIYHSKIRHILVRHEQNAGHAASGYARITGSPAVCIATSGPGALNLITAIATAYMDSIPLIAITGQVSSEQLGRDVFQEADITGAAEPFVKHSYLIKDVVDIPRIFKEAFHIASTGRQGPVLIDIPIDIQMASLDFVYPQELSIRSYKPSVNGHMGQIKRVLTAINKAKRPLLCAGGGIFCAGAQCELENLSSKRQIPIVTTMMGLGAISPKSPLCLGMIGMYGNDFANEAMSEADVILLIGARVGDRAIMSPIGLSKTTTIIHIDIDPAEIGKNIPTDIPLVGDIKNILSVIIDRIEPCGDKAWKSSEHNYVPPIFDKAATIDPRSFIRELMNMVSDKTCIVADVGQNQVVSASEFCVAHGRFLTSGGMGTMGYAVPCAIGASLADENRQIVAICGDGGFQMSMAELATIVANNVKIKIVLMDNHVLGLVKEMQDKFYGGRNEGILLDGNPDFCLLAKSYGIKAYSLTKSSDIKKVLAEFLADELTALLVVDSGGGGDPLQAVRGTMR